MSKLFHQLGTTHQVSINFSCVGLRRKLIFTSFRAPSCGGHKLAKGRLAISRFAGAKPAIISSQQETLPRGSGPVINPHNGHYVKAKMLMELVFFRRTSLINAISCPREDVELLGTRNGSKWQRDIPSFPARLSSSIRLNSNRQNARAWSPQTDWASEPGSETWPQKNVTLVSESTRAVLSHILYLETD